MPHRPASSRRGRRRQWGAAIVTLLALTTAACADFSDEQRTFGAQPSLTAPAVVPDDPEGQQDGRTSSPVPPSTPPSSPSSPSSPQSSGSPPPTGSGTEPDPCRPTDPAVIAACLDAPWGLAVLPGGRSALVGERTTGRILTIAPQQDPEPYATIDDIDASGDGGLLGIALSPAYDEDGIIYLYVTTATDNRVLRLAKGDVPKPVLVGIPKGNEHNGGPIAFGADGNLYIGTGDAGRPERAKDPDSLAGKLLRVDEFGDPVKSNPDPGSPVFASGFTDVTGMCSIGGTVAALDHRSNTDVLIRPTAGTDYGRLSSASTVWRWPAGQGGASDCAVSSTQLAFSSLRGERVGAIRIDQQGGFSGTPQNLVDDTYGRLRTLTLGGAGTEQELFWATTSNKDGHGDPSASDERVIVIVANAGGGGGGGPD